MRSCEIVTVLCRLTAQRPFIPSSTSRITSEGTSRTVEEIGATVTVTRWLTALSRVSNRTGRCLSGRANRQRWTSPRLSLLATPQRPPTSGIPEVVAAALCSPAGRALPCPKPASASGAPLARAGLARTGLPVAASLRDRRPFEASNQGQPVWFPYAESIPQYTPHRASLALRRCDSIWRRCLPPLAFQCKHGDAAHQRHCAKR